MCYEIGPSLKLICNILKSSTEQNCKGQRFEITQLLKTLNASEKFLVARYFCKLPWNIGSLYILSQLHELRILTASEYILSCDDSPEVQLILNDFLESQYDLITNLFVNSTMDSGNSIRINVILDECLENLFKDLVAKPELNDMAYLKHIHETTTGEILVKIIHKHLGIILKLQQSTATAAFSNFSSWINEGVDELKFPKDLYEKLLQGNIEDSLHYLLKQSSSEAFRDWKYYLIMLQTVCSGNAEKSGPIIRKYLNTRIKHCASVPCKRMMLHILLTARAASATTMDIAKNLNNYGDWYKNNIGEMKFFLKAEEFQNILDLLNQSLAYEAEVDYLEIHAAIAISPPILCGKLVQAYKSKCKQRLQQIKKGYKAIDVNESIVIEDSN
uniref:Fanconi anaemia group A protein N-terminal domain-containing protein n=1 Tax=Stomoxys calcitrans TaxID=35570 RepID=A0A1I8PI04_STOCA